MRRRRLGGIIVTGTAAIAALAAPVAPTVSAHGEAPSGHLVLIGGNLDEDDEILRRIVELADPDGPGRARARIAIVTAAAAPADSRNEAQDPDLNNAAANGLYYAALLQSYGAETYAVPIDESHDYRRDKYVPANARSAKVADRVRRSTGVFFGGGDQMRYVRTLFNCAPAPDEAFTDCEDTTVMSAIRDVVDGGGVIAGVSAGLTIQQGADMVTGGESYQAWRDGTTPGYLDDADALAHVPFGGFGFFGEALLDSHFTTWGRQARMIRLADETGHARVVGVDETTALVYDRSTRQGEVIGRHGVSLLDLSGATVDGSAVSGVRWTYLVDGDRIDFASGTVTPSAAPVPGPGSGPAPDELADVWDSIEGQGSVYSLRDLARAFVSSGGGEATGLTFETAPQYRTTLTRDAGTSWWLDGAGFERLGVAIATNP